MYRAAVRTGMGLSLLVCCAVVGCVTPPAPPPFTPDPLNPFVEEILKQEPLVFKNAQKQVIKVDPPRYAPDVVLREIPLHTRLADAQAVMERHGFSCQGGIKQDFRDCMICTAYKRKSRTVADRVTVYLFYEQKRLWDEKHVYEVWITVERDFKRSNGLFPEF
jgi:hypothetical protein